MSSEIGLITELGKDVALKAVSIRAKINGILAEVDVEQCYQNNEDINIETVYTFPLPNGAVLLTLDVQINDYTLKGQVKANSVAEEEYEEAIISGDTTVLLKKITDGLYSINLGNLLAGAKAVIHYKYALVNQWLGDRLRFYLPTTLAPKYGNPRVVGLCEHEFPSHSIAANYQFDFQADIEGQLATANVSCPTHCIVEEPNATGLHLQLQAKTQPMDRDLIIEIVRPEEYVGEGLWTQNGEEIIALSSFYPQLHSPSKNQPHCIKMVVDCSGSMCGDAIKQAGIALQEIVNQLEQHDWFNIIFFGSHHKLMFENSVQATPPNLLYVKRRLKTLAADLGGTEMYSALQAAYSSKTPHGVPTDILLITDGQIWDEDKLLCHAKASAHRHFTVGVGSAVSEAFLTQMAHNTGGASEFVTPNEKMSCRIVRHFERIKQPMLADCKIALTGKECVKQSPQHLNSLFAGDTINVFSWLPKHAAFDGQSEISFTIQKDDDTHIQQTQQVTLAYTSSNILARLAAHSKLTEVSKAEAISLAEQYQLVTDETCYILVKGNEQTTELGLPQLRSIAHQLPAGQSGFGRVLLDMPLMSGPKLSSGVDDFDELNLPAFLSKPHFDLFDDVTVVSTTVQPARSLADSLNHKFTPDCQFDMGKYDIDQIEILGEDAAIIRVLKKLKQTGYDEYELVTAWLSIYNEFNPDKPFSRHVTRLIKILSKSLGISTSFISTVRKQVKQDMVETFS